MRHTFLVIIGTLCIAAMAAPAGAVPPALVYQSQLFDDGGNPIADGAIGVTFRVTGVGGDVLYEERQEVEAIDGQVAAVIGAGADVEGNATGGIAAETFRGEGARYLEVEVDGYPATPPMAIASVPYAFFAQEALGAAEGAIDGRAIADGSIGIDDVGDAFIDGLAAELSSGDAAQRFVVHEELGTVYRAPTAAATIGVQPQFTYSGANDLQGVLSDLDRAIQRRDERVSAEESARIDAIDVEVQARMQSDALRVLKTGDTMSGTLTMQGDIAMDDLRTVDGLDLDVEIGKLEGRLDAAEKIIVGLPSLSSQVRAWGTVGCVPSPTIHGVNATVSYAGPSSCNVHFPEPMASAHYAVTVTCVGTSAVPLIAQKFADGFQVQGCGAFDFQTIGPQ